MSMVTTSPPRTMPKGRWLLHLGAFIFPSIAGVWAWTGPHEGLAAWGILALVPLFMALDATSPPERRAPTEAPAGAFDLQLYGLAALQLANVLGFVLSARQAGLFSAHTAAGIVFMGLNSGYSGIVVAHELCHRGEKHLRLLARALMVSVLYEHFTTEHVRGHHARVGTLEDGATARHGETYWAFLRRTVPQQFQSAWRLDRRTVAQGVAASALVTALAALLGPAALVAFVGQSVVAVMMLEAVNWFEHWGLVREGKRPSTVDSWDAESTLTLYGLVGLSRHADHHAHAARPYHALRHFEESPKLPLGYVALAIATVFANGWVRARLDAELRRKRLGPYRAA